jgi:hypothetical protein
MADLQVGAQILGYADRLMVILTKLSQAQAAADSAVSQVHYAGRAKAEMDQFYQSYQAHINKLIYFDSVGAKYLGKVFEEFGYTDEELTAVVLQWLDGGV